jgi:HSP20 family protein
MAETTTGNKNTTQSEAARPERTRSGRAYQPNVDIIEKTDELLVLADVPGARPEDIDVHFENRTLDIHAKVQPRYPENTRLLMQEYGVGDFHRSFEVSEAIDAARIYAECTDGVLTLHLPKAEAVKPRKIAVKPS